MKTIILYSTGCPKCKILEKKLDSRNINYTINTNIDEMKSLGILSVPVLSVDGLLLQFPDAVKWVNNYTN